MPAVFNQFSLAGRVAVVTGAAGGLGRATALGFADAGADLALLDIAVEPLAELREAVEARGRRALVRSLDVTSRADVQACHDEILAGFGRVDVLANVAGTTKRGPAEDFDEDDYLRVIDINLHGTFRTCQIFGRTMLKQGKGSIVNFASVGALVGLYNSVAYSASKGGVAQLTRVFAIEWAQRGVRVNALAPCTFETPLVKQVLSYDPEYTQTVLAGIPIGRPGQPDEIVGAALFLASDASAMVTGSILAIDGGYLAR